MARPNRKKPHDVSRKKWQAFEAMVARIEQFLGQKGIKTKLQDRIKDVVTGTMREVDASLRYQMGSAQMLVTIECRDRKRIEDVLWIEQLVTKQHDIRSDKCIAVSSAGFSKAAIAKANHHNIDIRLVQELTNADIVQWFDALYVDVRYHTISLVGLAFLYEGDETMEGVELADDIQAAIKADPWEAAIVFDRDTNKWVSVDFFLDDWVAHGGVLDNPAIPLETLHRTNIAVHPTPFLYTRTNKGTLDVRCLEIALDVTMFKKRVLLTDRLQYSNETSPLAFTGQGAFSIHGHPCGTFVVLRTSDDSKPLSIAIEPHDPAFFAGKFVKISIPETERKVTEGNSGTT